ncbi:hypothetical protein NDU88_006086 [Pleurodeles waltl]|uniref:Secreted protein n=1 Tax=Pleurodeles waltl TaxID=8319 RepID=A0AAV7L361_PLEWA|nr:hypothetical protein NDU88_006086 [Pleurodeles waltl]
MGHTSSTWGWGARTVPRCLLLVSHCVTSEYEPPGGELRITRTRCTVHSSAAAHKGTERSALKSCRSQGHGALCTQEVRIKMTQYAVHSRAADHKSTERSTLKSCRSQGHGALCTQEVRIKMTRYAVHSRAADHKDTERGALKSC